ncbi:MAG: general secretion pathway protein GspB [Halieaceae bacterium]|jgi:hypothetical protein|nr:general secretion pathway protein GspB [Halieaceae bacterium]
MSLILDALARSERERQRESASLEQRVQADAAAPSGAQGAPWWLIGALAAVVAVLAVLYWRSTYTGAGADSSSATQSSAVDEEVSASTAAVLGPTALPAPRVPADGTGTTTTAAAVASSAAAKTQAPAADRGAIADLYAQASREAVAAASGERERRGPAENTGDEETAAVSASSAGTMASVPAPASPAEEVLDLETALRRARIEAAASALLPHAAPLLASLSQQFRDSLPTLMYLRHDYNPAGVSTVLINGETLRIGASTRGVEVREILPDSVILEFAGTEFRLRALSSWVNL